jgi:hypothetical protein
MFVALAEGGRLYIWAHVYTENWSAFAPDFKVGTPRCRARAAPAGWPKAAGARLADPTAV